MRFVTRCLRFALFYLFTAPVFSQNVLITYEKSDSLFVCGTDTFFIQIQNTGTNPVTGATLNVALPNGVTYLPGSISGATEQNVGNLQQPVFSLTNLASGATASVALLVSADCAAADALDAGQLFIANLSVQSPAGSASVSTSGIVLQTGLLLIESVEDELMSGEKGDTLLRKICVKNTRLGKIGNLHFEDAHEAGFELTVSGAASQTHTSELSIAEFDSSFFTAFGDGDEWLELGETACFTEKIVITDCGMPEFTNPSLLRVGWGCGGDVCRYDSTLVAIETKVFSKNPLLYFNTTWSPPINNCGGEPAVMRMNILNAGATDAQDVLITVQSDEILQMGLDSGSFRLVLAGDTIALSPNLSFDITLPSCGLTFQSHVTFTIPLVSAGDSVEVLFDAYTCIPECEESLPNISGQYFYRKPCPVNGFVSGLLYFRSDTNYLTEAYVGMHIGGCLQDGNTYPFFYSVDTKRLTQSDGFLNVRLNVPFGLSWDDSCAVQLGGVSPVATTIDNFPGTGSAVTLSFALPLPADSLVMPFCLRYECHPDIVCKEQYGPVPDRGGSFIVYTPIDTSCGDFTCFVTLGDNTYFSTTIDALPACAISHCDSVKVGLRLDCSTPGGGGGEGGPGGGGPGSKYVWDFKTYRLNYGLEDNDDDRNADNGATSAIADAPGVRRDRFLPGDTMRVEYFGYVETGGGFNTFPRFIWHEITRSDMLGNTETDFFPPRFAQSDFTNYDTLVYVRNFIRIKYADGTEASCPFDDLNGRGDQHHFRISIINIRPESDMDELVTQNHRFLANLNNLFDTGCLPKATLDQGDSIFIYTDFKFEQNFTPLSSNKPDPPLVGFRTALDMRWFGHFAWNRHPLRKSQYSGYKSYTTANLFGIRPCENSIEVKRFRHAIRIARENMFPFEVRPLVEIKDYRQTILPDFTVESAKLEYLVLQDSTPWLSNLVLPFAQSDSILDVDFDPVFANPVDEGFMLRTNITFLPNCDFNKPDSSKQFVSLQYAPNFHTPEFDIDTFRNGIGFFSNSPRLALETVDTILYIPTQAFSLDFFLKNYNVSPSVNTWIAAVSPSGEAYDFELFEMPQQQPFVATNGIYQLSDVGGFSTRALRLTGLNKSCNSDTLLLVFGWGCGPFTSLEQSGCGRDTLVIELRLQNPELELEVLHEPEVAVCDSSDYFEFEIYNAKTGFAYEPYATIKLPPGLFIVPGSCQISYPAGSNFVNIADPESLLGNIFQWDIAAIQAAIAANGLPGVEADPQNAMRIRFRTYTECGFVSNTQVIYGTRGTEPCGRSTNILNKPGDPLKINGLNPAYGVIIGLQAVGTPAEFCGGSQQFLVQLTLLGIPSPGDSVYVLLPQGVTYEAGSYQPGQNAPAGPPTVEVSGIRLALPVNLGAGSVVAFQFRVAFDQLAGCIDQTIIAQTRVRTEVFCPTIGAPCTVYAATGEAIWNLNLQHPELDLGDANASISGNQISTTISVNNIGQVPASGVTAQIWQDVDGNHVVSPGDILLQTVENSQTLAPGGSLALSALLDLDPALLCDLLVVLPAAENCICAAQTLPLNNLTLEHPLQEYCDFQTVSIGVPEQPGFIYQWLTTDGIACGACATTDFTPSPATPPGQVVALVLEEKSADCTVRHTFSLSFGTLPVSVNVNNPVICKGENAVLTAQPPGNTYQWSPNPGNLPNLQEVTVSPSLTTTYTVTVTFPNTCTQTATATVIVLLPDTTLLPGLSTCQGDPVDVLGNVTDVAGLYSDILQNTDGCDSIIYQNLNVLPRPLTEESLGFCQGDTLFVFDTLLTQSGQLCRTYTAANGCDSLHCIAATAFELPALTDPDTLIASPDNPVVLNGPGGYVTYTWIPADPNCPNCPSITVPSDSGYVEYQLIVTDANGCEGVIVYRIIFFPPCDAQRLRIPNAFTPNSDGINDVFRVVPYEGLEIIGSLTIYDRWGEKVYENRGNVFWDGTIDGKPGPSDVYVYRIDIVCDGEPEAIWGDVTLLR